MNRLIHFEIHADEPERAIDFYKKIFNWEIEKFWNGGIDYWMIMTDKSDSKEAWINGWLLKRPCPIPKNIPWSNAFVCTILVDDFDKTSKEILKAWWIVAMEKFAIIWMAWQWYFIDTEGNTFGIHQPDKNAK